MSATELVVVMNCVASLQQQIDSLRGENQSLREQVEALEGRTLATDRKLLGLQTHQADLREEHNCLAHRVHIELSHAMEEASNLKALAVEDTNYCDGRILEDWLEQRYPDECC